MFKRVGKVFGQNVKPHVVRVGSKRRKKKLKVQKKIGPD